MKPYYKENFLEGWREVNLRKMFEILKKKCGYGVSARDYSMHKGLFEIGNGQRRNPPMSHKEYLL